MDATDPMDQVAAALKPGAISRDGFLGKDRRRLATILAADDAEVRRHGLTHAALAARLTVFRDAAVAAFGEWAEVPPHFEVQAESVRGGLPCPFGDPGLHAKTNVTVRNRTTGREFRFTDLNLHLIAAHGFYEGRGSPFRVEPADVIAVLGH